LAIMTALVELHRAPPEPANSDEDDGESACA